MFEIYACLRADKTFVVRDGTLEPDLAGTGGALEADLGGRVVTQTAGFTVADGFTVIILALSIVEPSS